MSYRSLNERLDRFVGARKHWKQIFFDSQRQDPEKYTNTQRKDATDGNHVPASFEPRPHRHEQSGKRKQERDEDEDAIDDTGGERKLVIQEVSGGFVTGLGDIVEVRLDDEAKSELDAAGGEEQRVGGQGG